MITMTQLKAYQLQARKEKDTIKATLLTTFLGEIQGKITALPIDKRTEAKEAEVIQSCLTSFLKQNRDAQTMVKDETALNTLKAEENILKKFEPQRMGEDELTAVIKEMFPEITAKTIGPNVGALKKKLGDQLDAQLAKKIMETLVS